MCEERPKGNLDRLQSNYLPGQEQKPRPPTCCHMNYNREIVTCQCAVLTVRIAHKARFVCADPRSNTQWTPSFLNLETFSFYWFFLRLSLETPWQMSSVQGSCLKSNKTAKRLTIRCLSVCRIKQGRQCMYKRNTEVRSCSFFWRGKGLRTSFPACNAHAPYYTAIFVLFGPTIFFHFVSQTAPFSENKLRNVKCIF